MPNTSQSTTSQTPDADLAIEPFDGEPTEDSEILPLQNGSFPVVGIGGSAGAIPTLQTFFREMPDEPGMAFVVILHLSPDYESNLDSIIGKVTKMPVVQVMETVEFEINHVYVIPPTHLLTMHDGHIELARLQREAGKRVAVDLFFRALAESQEARAICIILSGTDSDGSIGLKRVKERGGLTIAQDPTQAQYDEMPRSAIETGMVDWVLPVEEQNFLLVIFDLLKQAPAPAPIADEPVARRLESELQHVKAQLKATSKQFEVSTEELKASNEELQAMNEELRSATEELETGKEELQSVNEELVTVNAELKHKVEEVSYANSNLSNLMASTDIATIFLDRTGRIKRYTPRAIELFNLIPTDVGRPLTDLRHKFTYENWADDAQKTLANLGVIEHEVRTTEGGWFLSRMLPYRTIEDHIDGVVLTFVDITARRNAEESSRASEERFRLLVGGVRDYAIFLFDESGTITSWNEGVERVFGYRESEWIGRNWDIIFPSDDRHICAELMQQARDGVVVPIERWELHKDGSQFWASDVTNALYDANCQLRGYVKIVRDMSENHKAEAQLRAVNEKLEARVAARTHELEELNEALNAENLDRRKAEDGRLILVRQLEDELGRLKQLLQGIPAGVIIAHSDGRPLFVNTRARLALSMANGVEHDPAVSDWLYAEGGPLKRALAGENTASEEIGFSRDGNELSLSVSAEPIPDAMTRGDAPISAAIVAFQDVTERKRAESARQQLLQRLVSAQEEERTRISRELHDQMGQSLTALLMVIDTMTNSDDEDCPSQKRLAKLKKLVEELMDQAHLLAWELRPPALDNLGLRAALEQYLKEWSRSTGIRADFASRGLTNLEHLDKVVETTLYRVVQEALTNVHRHSGSEIVSVLVERMEGEVTVIIEDNGSGFDVEAVTSGNSERLGLVGMRERIELIGGSLTIESTAEQGTTVYARVAGETTKDVV